MGKFNIVWTFSSGVIANMDDEIELKAFLIYLMNMDLSDVRFQICDSGLQWDSLKN